MLEDLETGKWAVSELVTQALLLLSDTSEVYWLTERGILAIVDKSVQSRVKTQLCGAAI